MFVTGSQFSLIVHWNTECCLLFTNKCKSVRCCLVA